MSRLRGQGYDGASNMRGELNGLKKLVLDVNPYAFYVHCFAHQLQLVVVAVVKGVLAASDFFGNTNNGCVFKLSSEFQNSSCWNNCSYILKKLPFSYFLIFFPKMIYFSKESSFRNDEASNLLQKFKECLYLKNSFLYKCSEFSKKKISKKYPLPFHIKKGSLFCENIGHLKINATLIAPLQRNFKMMCRPSLSKVLVEVECACVRL